MKPHVILFILPIFTCTARAQESPVIKPVDPPTRPDQFLTQSQLVQAFRAGQYSLVVRETARILTTPAALKNYDDFNLQVLRAEATLQQKDTLTAIQLFELAAKAAPDENRQSVMSATALLVRRQLNLKYSTKSTDAQGKLLPPPENGELRIPVQIDILDLTARKAALKALFYDELYKTDDLVTVAAKSNSIRTLIPVTKALEALAPLERAATGAIKATQALEKRVGTAAQDIFHVNLDALAKEAAELRTKASRMVALVPQNGVGIAGTHFDQVGLQLREVDRLNNMLAAIKRVPATTDELALRLHLGSNFFETTEAEAVAARKTVEDAIDVATIKTGNPNEPH